MTSSLIFVPQSSKGRFSCCSNAQRMVSLIPEAYHAPLSGVQIPLTVKIPARSNIYLNVVKVDVKTLTWNLSFKSPFGAHSKNKKEEKILTDL